MLRKGRYKSFRGVFMLFDFFILLQIFCTLLSVQNVAQKIVKQIFACNLKNVHILISFITSKSVSNLNCKFKVTTLRKKVVNRKETHKFLFSHLAAAAVAKIKSSVSKAQLQLKIHP